MMKTIYLLARDPRYDLLAQRAQESGFQVKRKADDTPSEKAVYLFPLAAKNDEILPILSRALPGSVALMGKGDEVIRSLANKKQIRLHCLLEDQAYLLQNARATAEGTLSQVIEKTDRCLTELCFLIYGYGNCGKEIAKLLWLCGCEVWVWSREKGQKSARQDGFNVYHAPTLGLGMFDGVINTVPDCIFSLPHLSTLRQDCYFFQVASGLSGISPEEMEKRGIRFYTLHGLPGAFSPASEADAIWEILMDMLKNQNETE